MQFCLLCRIAKELLLGCAAVLVTGCCGDCSAPLPPSEAAPPETVTFYTYEVLRVYPHDPEAFTQGLVFSGGFLYEGTGLNSSSSVRKVDLETGEILQQVMLPRAYFGEGIGIEGGRMVQLTWRSQAGFIYALNTLEKQGDCS